MRVTHSVRVSVAAVTIVALLAGPIAPFVVAQAPAAVPPEGPDGGWPHAYTTASGAALLVYQPQVASWADQKHMVAYAALSYMPKDAKQPALGTVMLESDTKVAVDERLVSFSELKITESNFPTLQRDQLKTVVGEITAAVPLDERVIALDRVLANIDTSQIIPKNVEGMKADPPVIFFSKTAAVLVNIDGEPIWAPIPQNDLSSAVNTNWDLFQHGPTKTFYLRNERAWLKATDVKGPWAPAGTLPESFAKLPADENWKDVKSSLPGQRVNASQVPRVFVSFEPAELILLRGEPNYLAVQGANTAPLGQQHGQRCLPNEPDGRRLLPGRGPMVLGARLHRSLDVRHAGAARSLQANSARARAVPRSRIGAWHEPGGRGRHARANSADGARQQDRASARGRVSGPSRVPAD